MTTVYARRSSSDSVASVLLTLVIVMLLVVGALWYLSQHHGRPPVNREARDRFDAVSAKIDKAADRLFSKRTVRTADSNLGKAGSAASSALSKMGAAASSAVSETSADLKAAADKQKEQNALHGATNK